MEQIKYIYTQKITSQERFTGQYNVELRLLT